MNNKSNRNSRELSQWFLNMFMNVLFTNASKKLEVRVLWHNKQIRVKCHAIIKNIFFLEWEVGLRIILKKSLIPCSGRRFFLVPGQDPGL